nr:Gag-Pol polyprotein [Tanacetum cinerariifolium]
MSDSSGGGMSDLDDMDDIDMIATTSVRARTTRNSRTGCCIIRFVDLACIFWGSGASNDLTVLNNSPLFDDLLDDIAPVAPFELNEVTFEKGDGENLDKMKEKGDECIFVGYSNQSRAYRVFNKRTRVIMESIHVNFDELPQMASDQNSSDPAPECQTMALKHDSLSPGRKCQENVSHGDKTVTTLNELDLLFSPMFDELLNGPSQVVSKSSAVSAVDAPNQQTHAENDQVANDEFINIFSTPVQDQGETSSRHEELHQFDRLDVWELVDRPLCTNVINLKWLWKNKRDEENTVIRNKSRLVAKGYAQKKELILKNLSHPLLEQERQETAERVHRRNYIYRERLNAEERLMVDYFGPNLKYLLYYSQKCGASNDLIVLNNSSLFDDLLDGIAPVAQFELNEVTFEKGYYLADSIYPQWSSFVKSFMVANSEKNVLFKRKQESARKDIEKAFWVLQGQMDLFTFIRYSDPTKVRIRERERAYGKGGDSSNCIDKFFDEGNDDVPEETVAKDVSERLREDHHAAASNTRRKSLATICDLVSDGSSVPSRVTEPPTVVFMPSMPNAGPTDSICARNDIVVTTTVTANAFAVPPPKVRVVSKNLEILGFLPLLVGLMRMLLLSRDELSSKVASLESKRGSLVESTFEFFKERMEATQDEQVKVLVNRVTELDAQLLEMAAHLDEEFYPRFLTAISRQWWILTHRLKLVLFKCLQSLKCCHALGQAISCTVNKGIQDDLRARVEHGKARRELSLIKAYDPSTEAKYVEAMNSLGTFDFSLLSELNSKKYASIVDLMSSLCLEGPLAEILRAKYLQPSPQQLRLPIYRPEDNPLSSRSLIGEASTSAASATSKPVTTLSMTFASFDVVPPLSISNDQVFHNKDLPAMTFKKEELDTSSK